MQATIYHMHFNDISLRICWTGTNISLHDRTTKKK